MCSRDEINSVIVCKGFCDVCSEQVSGTSWGESPTVCVIWVRPEKIAHWAVMGDLLLPVDGSYLQTDESNHYWRGRAPPDNTAYLVDTVEIRTQTTMNAKHASIHNSTQREVIKDLTAISPHIRRAILPLAFVIEPIHLRNLARLVVSADERDAIRVSHFEREQQQEGLDAVEPAVDEIACRISSAQRTMNRVDCAPINK